MQTNGPSISFCFSSAGFLPLSGALEPPSPRGMNVSEPHVWSLLSLPCPPHCMLSLPLMTLKWVGGEYKWLKTAHIFHYIFTDPYFPQVAAHCWCDVCNVLHSAHVYLYILSEHSDSVHAHIFSLMSSFIILLFLHSELIIRPDTDRLCSGDDFTEDALVLHSDLKCLS